MAGSRNALSVVAGRLMTERMGINYVEFESTDVACVRRAYSFSLGRRLSYILELLFLIFTKKKRCK